MLTSLYKFLTVLATISLLGIPEALFPLKKDFSRLEGVFCPTISERDSLRKTGMYVFPEISNVSMSLAEMFNFLKIFLLIKALSTLFKSNSIFSYSLY